VLLVTGATFLHIPLVLCWCRDFGLCAADRSGRFEQILKIYENLDLLFFFLLGESPFLSQIALCCLISVCHAEEVTQPLE